MNIAFLKNPIIRFLLLFILLLLLLDNGAIAYMGITSPGNIYVPFLDHYLNIFDWYRSFLLHGAHLLIEVIGYSSTLSGKYHLQIIGGHGIQLVYSCLGAGLLSLWFSFVLAYPGIFKKKIVWMFTGFFLISFLNMIRLAALVIIASKTNLNFDNHHTYYNIAVYTCITIMIYFYTKEPKEDSLPKQ